MSQQIKNLAEQIASKEYSPSALADNNSIQQSVQMVKQAIQDDQGLSAVAKDIHITVEEGTVILDGEVATQQQSNLANNTAEAVAVNDKVKNNLDVTNKINKG